MFRNKKYIIVTIMALSLIGASAQIFRTLQIGFGSFSASSIFETFSTSKGSRPFPRMTEAQRDAISSPATGLMIYNTDTDKVNVYDGAAWGELSGSGGGKNYFDGGDFESGIGIASTYDDTGAYVDGTGGSPTALTISQNTTTPLEKTADLKITKAASDASGEGVTLTSTTIDKYVRGRYLWFTAEIDCSDANYTDGDFALKAFSTGTDNQILNVFPVAGLNDDGSIQKRSQRVVAYIPTNNNTDSTVRVSLHMASDSATASALSCYVDEAKLSPSGVVPGAIITPWESFTPTWNGTTGDGTLSGIKRRVGDTLEMQIHFTMGSTSSFPAGQAEWDLPSGLSIDTAKLASTNQTQTFNSAYANDQTGSVSVGTVQANASNGTFYIWSDGGTNSWRAASPFTWASTDYLSFTVKVPIDGWKASASLSTTEVNLTSVKVSGKNNGGETITADSTNVTFTESSDPFNAWNGTQFTAPKAGRYYFSGIARFTASATRSVYIYTATQTVYMAQSTGVVHGFAGQIDLDAGEVASIRVDSGGTLSSGSAATHHISITQQPDLTHFSVYGETDHVESKSSGQGAYTITADQWGDLASISLPPGVWDISAVASYISNGGVTTTNIITGVSTTSGNSDTGLVLGDNYIRNIMDTTSGSWTTNTLPAYKVTVTSTTTYYLKSFAGSSIANLNVAYRISARKIQ